MEMTEKQREMFFFLSLSLSLIKTNLVFWVTSSGRVIINAFSPTLMTRAFVDIIA